MVHKPEAAFIDAKTGKPMEELKLPAGELFKSETTTVYRDYHGDMHHTAIAASKATARAMLDNYLNSVTGMPNSECHSVSGEIIENYHALLDVLSKYDAEVQMERHRVKKFGAET